MTAFQGIYKTFCTKKNCYYIPVGSNISYIVSLSIYVLFKGAGLTGSASSNTNTAAASLAAVAGLSNTSGVNMLALQHLFAGSPLTTGLPASGLTNSVSGKCFCGKEI